MKRTLTQKQHYLLRSLGFTIAAMALYVPANIYPFMTMKYSGQYHYTTIWDGIRTLYDENMLITATIVLAASIIIPIFKLIALLFVILADMFDVAYNVRTSLLALIEFIGRWSMLDIFLVAIMVALVKFGSFATVSADSGTYLLGCVVILTMLASATLSECYEVKLCET
ncbi:MAG TPA: paraquat-inducible protein A [Gammaproteobacteria bacterium]|nr:paraquat-inducible protein A [Gammaproteobacteria bacterium]